MKKNHVPLELTVLTACMLLGSGLHLGAQSVYEYDWVGGQPGFSGKIFLDASSSASAPNGGSAADVLAGSYLTTPLGTFSVLDTAFSSSQSYTLNMQWNQTQINDMFLFFTPTTPINVPYYNQPALGLAAVGLYNVDEGLEVGVAPANGGFATLYANDDFTGKWAAVAVPEPATLALVGFGSAAFLVFHRRVNGA